jgi:hypothetical protein
VKVFAADTDEPLLGFYAYDAGFGGGVRVAGGDVDNDGFDDLLTAAGSGGDSRVKVFSGRDGSELRSFSAYDGFNGPIDIAGGDVNGDGFTDIITGAGVGGGPHVKVFSGASGEEIGGFFAFDSSFGGGVRVAAGDVDGDGTDEILVGAGAGAEPELKVFRADGTLLGSFLAYGAGFAGGIDVAAFDGDGDGRSEWATGAGPGGGPHLRAFADDASELFGLMAFDPSFSGGVMVG